MTTVTAEQASAAVAAAESQVGTPYGWGAEKPGVAFDCSGLTQWAYAQAGVALPRTTYEQVLLGDPVGRLDLQPGDLVFPDPGHVQIYVGDGNIVEAPHTGLDVRVVPLWGFWTARRLAGSSSAGSVADNGGPAVNEAPTTLTAATLDADTPTQQGTGVNRNTLGILAVGSIVCVALAGTPAGPLVAVSLVAVLAFEFLHPAVSSYLSR